MELVVYHLVEVKTKAQEKAFLKLPHYLYEHKGEYKWVSPFYADAKRFFNTAINPYINEDGIKRWLLYDVNKHLIGRIAAFFWSNEANEMSSSTGSFGFFECTDDEKASNILLNAAAQWLLSKGIKKMQGPFNYGGPGFFSGSLFRGFFEPAFGAPYNPSYYNELYLKYGFSNALHQKTYVLSLNGSTEWKFVEKKASPYMEDSRYQIKTFGPKDCELFAKEFTRVFNKVWVQIPGMAPMTEKRALNRCNLLKPALSNNNIVFVYFEEEPIAFLLTVPEIHDYVRKFKGNYNLSNQLLLEYSVKHTDKIKTLSGLIYGVVPEFQNQNMEAFLLVSFRKLIDLDKYNKLIINRVGSFMPGFENVVQQLNAKLYHEFKTYEINLNEDIKKKWELAFFPDEEGLCFTLNKFDEKQEKELAKVLLIHPRGSNFYAKMGAMIPPLGLAYIAAVIRQKGHYVKLIDLGIDKKLPSPELIKLFDVVGITADTPSYPEALSVAKAAKEAGTTVIMGGYHVSFLDKEALMTGVVDFVVRGEGEEIFLNLIETLKKKGDLLEVQGISFMKDGKYQRNKDAAPPKDLDNLPFPARDLLHMKAYKNQMNGVPFTNLITSRGCPFNCYFCSSSKFGGLKWRYRSAKSIVDEIEFLYHKYGYKAFSFMDDNFTLKPKRIFEFADELEKRNLTDIQWWCFSRVDILVRNEDMVKRMSEVGAYMIFLGLESNNEALLDNYNKHIGNDQQQQAIALLRKYGIKIHGSYIMGDIKETIPMVNQTIEWAKSINAKTTQFSILTPYPGTALYNDIEKEGRFLHKEWSLYDALHPTIKLDYISPRQLQNLLIKAYRKAYLNPARIFGKTKDNNENIKTKKQSPQVKTSLIQKLRTIYIALSFIFALKSESIKGNKIIKKS